MPQFKMSELHLDPATIKEGDKLEFTIKRIGHGMVELDYTPEVEAADENADEKTMPLPKLREKMVEKHGMSDTEGY